MTNYSNGWEIPDSIQQASKVDNSSVDFNSWSNLSNVLVDDLSYATCHFTNGNIVSPIDYAQKISVYKTFSLPEDATPFDIAMRFTIFNTDGWYDKVYWRYGIYTDYKGYTNASNTTWKSPNHNGAPGNWGITQEKWDGAIAGTTPFILFAYEQTDNFHKQKEMLLRLIEVKVTFTLPDPPPSGIMLGSMY